MASYTALKEGKMKGQIVFITGSSSGIGRETAYRFSKAGAKLVLTYYKGKTRGEAAEKRCRKLGATDTLLLHLDVTDSASVAEATRKVKRKYDAIDFLINNAGVGVFIPFREQTVRDIERQIRTNLEGLIKLTRAFIPAVKKGIVNIASAAGQEAYEDMSVYYGTKFGVRGFTQTLALEYPRLKICCVNPDETATRLSGYQGRPPGEVAEVIFRVVSDQIKCSGGKDVNVWEVME
jgi:NAD(P)-dependent dehydrogenase (short-subunit alcohol dehydrogenase family)